MNARTSREQLEAGPESLFMSHCVLVVVLSEHAVLGVMIHEISQTLALGFFFNLNFLYFFSCPPLEQPYYPTIHLYVHWTAHLRTETQFKQLRMLG